MLFFATRLRRWCQSRHVDIVQRFRKLMCVVYLYVGAISELYLSYICPISDLYLTYTWFTLDAFKPCCPPSCRPLWRPWRYRAVRVRSRADTAAETAGARRGLARDLFQKTWVVWFSLILGSKLWYGISRVMLILGWLISILCQEFSISAQ